MQQLLPTIYIQEDGLAAAWEKSIVETWWHGMMIPTEYDKPSDPESRDVTALIVVKDPFSEPRYHRNFPGGIDDLEKYVGEVVDGILDHQIDREDPQKWHYTYHERFTDYHMDSPWPRNVDQLSKVIDVLGECAFSRRAQAITWQPWTDAGDSEPPCVQRLWFRVLKDANGQERLCMSMDIRSNDAYKAAYMNMYAMTWLQARMAYRLSLRLDREILVGQYTHYANSYHLYGSYAEEIKRFMDCIENNTRDWENRTWTTEQISDLLAEARTKLIAAYGLHADWPTKG